MPTNPHVPTDAALDEWTRHVLDVHFDPDGGTPYWLEYAAARDLDVRDAVEGFADLREVFEPFDEEVLRTLPAEAFAPRSMGGSRRVYETGGTTGPPKRVVMRDYWRLQSEWTAAVYEAGDLPTGNVLCLGPPGGANNAGTFVQHLADAWDALPYFVNMDPRWAGRLAREDPDRHEEYLEHLFEQAERVLATQDVTVVFTTSRLLERPRVREMVTDHGVECLFHGGTPLDPDTARVLQREWYADVPVIGEYGNTLMGVAPEPRHLRPPAERDYVPQYVPCYPYFVPEVVGHDGDPVDYGERGTVRLTVLSEELFVPQMLERDEAVRVRGEAPLEWDWIADPRTPTDRTDADLEGVY